MKSYLPCFVLSLLLFSSIDNKAQVVTIYNQNFGDANNLVFPAGWSAPDSTWGVDNTNISSGYADASGQTNMVIRNTVTTGTYSLITEDIETSGYENIRVLWGRRISNNFTLSGSTIPTLDISIDGGTNWVNVAFYDTFIDNTWTHTNAGDDISLPALANDQPAVKFRWTVDIVNNLEGSYRIDDFIVRGEVKQTSVNINNIENQIDIRLANMDLYLMNQGAEIANLIIYDLQGRPILNSLCNNQVNRVNLNHLASGIYIAQVQTANSLINRKFALTK
jgi:hypothetical protein